jgi:hypothetical protein
VYLDEPRDGLASAVAAFNQQVLLSGLKQRFHTEQHAGGQFDLNRRTTSLEAKKPAALIDAGLRTNPRSMKLAGNSPSAAACFCDRSTI